MPGTRAGHPPLVDANRPFSAPGGGYTSFPPEPNGTPVQVRPADGTHFTLAGIGLYGTTIADALGPA